MAESAVEAGAELAHVLEQQSRMQQQQARLLQLMADLTARSEVAINALSNRIAALELAQEDRTSADAFSPDVRTPPG